MCGRTACTLEPKVLCQACSYKEPAGGQYKPAEWRESSNGKEYQPSANFSPTFYGPVMHLKRLADPSAAPRERIIQPMMWGMIPPWHRGSATKHGLTTNNCRIEGIAAKKLYSEPLFKGRRCAVLCDGFYEWRVPPESAKRARGTPTKSAKPAKQPYFIYSPQPEGVSIVDPDTWQDRLDQLWSPEEGWKGPKPLIMAGLFDTWKSPEDGSIVHSYSVLTMDASPAFAWIHERMPVVLETEEEIDSWLNSVDVPYQKALSLLKASANLVSHPVATDVGNVKNQGRHLVQPIDLGKPKPLSGSGLLMAKWLKKSPKQDPASRGDVKPESGLSGSVKRHLPLEERVGEEGAPERDNSPVIKKSKN